jgi:hypothetical protein
MLNVVVPGTLLNPKISDLDRKVWECQALMIQKKRFIAPSSGFWMSKYQGWAYKKNQDNVGNKKLLYLYFTKFYNIKI